MFGAIYRYFRALGYLVTGRVDSARKELSSNPAVVQATYDKVIEEKRKRIMQYKDAVGSMIAQEEKKKLELKRQSEEAARLKQLREGAAMMARKLVEKYQGNVEAVKADPDYMKCQASYKDFSSTLEEKEARCKELEEDIGGLEKSVAQHKTQLTVIMREFERLRQEKNEAVADVVMAKEEKEIADMMAGVSEDRTARELEDLRELRREVKAGARVSREMAGVDAKHSEAEFLEYATKSQADNEFDKLIGLTRESEGSSAGRESRETRLPEG